MLSEYDTDDDSVIFEDTIDNRTGAASEVVDDTVDDIANIVDVTEQEDELDFIPKNKYAEYRREYVQVENPMAPDLVSRFEKCELVSISTERIEKSGYSFVPIGTMDVADVIALAELKARKCPLLLRRIVGWSCDDVKKIMKIHYELHNPNDMIYTRR
jgi:hypothetical protein